MVEMTESAAILHHATERSLVLMDEVGRGTSTFDGMALAFAICRHLVEKNRCLTLFATHYFELTLLANEYPELANVHLDAIEHGERIVFLHAVEDGPANQSYGIQVAALAGIPIVGGQGRSPTVARIRATRGDQPAATRSLCHGIIQCRRSAGAATFAGQRAAALDRPRPPDTERGARRPLRAEIAAAMSRQA
jgi:hypothetical protein